MNTVIIGIVIAVIGLFIIYFGLSLWFRTAIRRTEKVIIDLFEQKVAKIPAVIEVMRPYVIDEKAFDAISLLHSEAMIHRYETIYDLLEHNAHIHNQFLFLMQLSVHIPGLQKNEYFLYIRDFVIGYERKMRTKFENFNDAVDSWNTFMFYKNITIIGLLLPGKMRDRL